MNKYRFPAIYAEARTAGMAAGTGATPTPMIVGSPSTPFGNDIDPNKKTYFVPDGPCGFAWINIRPGNCKFANWLKKERLARGSYRGGVDVWVGEFGQSMARKEAYAGAFSKVLREEGIDAYADSRMD